VEEENEEEEEEEEEDEEEVFSTACTIALANSSKRIEDKSKSPTVPLGPGKRQ
jgi:hypothetical protein